MSLGVSWGNFLTVPFRKFDAQKDNSRANPRQLWQSEERRKSAFVYTERIRLLYMSCWKAEVVECHFWSNAAIIACNIKTFAFMLAFVAGVTRRRNKEAVTKKLEQKIPKIFFQKCLHSIAPYNII